MRLCLAWLVLFASCAAPAEDPEVEVVPAAPTSTTPVTPPTLPMAGHFQDSVAIKDAVIAGDLPGVRAPARRLRERPGQLPESWAPFMARKAELATSALAASDLQAAAKAAAGLASACGECHTAVGDGPRFPSPSSPPPVATPPNTREHMQRHQWAADRMWEGLIARDDAAWTAGAAALADAPLSRDTLMADVELPDSLLELNDRVHALGARAQTTTAWPTRTELYGEFLATCATCHQGGC